MVSKFDSALHEAADKGDAATVQQLLQRPDAQDLAMEQDRFRNIPLHYAAAKGNISNLEALLAAAPEGALVQNKFGWAPLHHACFALQKDAALALLAAAPASAGLRCRVRGYTPIEILLHTVNWTAVGVSDSTSEARYRRQLATALQLLLETPLPGATILASLHHVAVNSDATATMLSFYTPLVCSRALSSAEWELVPLAPPGLGAALPVVLARSEAEAACLVRRLPEPSRQRLRTAALSLARLQRKTRVQLDGALAGRIMTLFDAQ